MIKNETKPKQTRTKRADKLLADMLHEQHELEKQISRQMQRQHDTLTKKIEHLQQQIKKKQDKTKAVKKAAKS